MATRLRCLVVSLVAVLRVDAAADVDVVVRFFLPDDEDGIGSDDAGMAAFTRVMAAAVDVVDARGDVSPLSSDAVGGVCPVAVISMRWLEREGRRVRVLSGIQACTKIHMTTSYDIT